MYCNIKIYLLFFIDIQLFQTVMNHPVHIMNQEGQFSPSSFIPFCYFGEKFIGTEVDEFTIPVCNIFKPRNYFNQLCYEANLNDLKDNNNEKVRKQLKMGLTLVLDYNEERQNYKIKRKNKLKGIKELYRNDEDVSIHMDTISMIHLSVTYVPIFGFQILLNFFLVKVNTTFTV